MGKDIRKNSRIELLPESLVGRAVLDLLRKRIAQEGIEPSHEAEPDWNQMRVSLRDEHALSEAESDELTRALERLWLLPFHRYETCSPLVLFFYTGLPAIKRRFTTTKNRNGLVLTNGFRVMVDLLLQGCALFPGEPHHIGQELMNAIVSPADASRGPFLAIARLLAASAGGRWGCNHFLSENPNEIAIYEHLSRHGRYDGVLANAHKYESYRREVEAAPLFWREWAELKAAFKNVAFWDKSGIVRRSPSPEATWWRDPLPDFKKPHDCFQAAFDIFCCKWFLYGMQRAKPRDKPLIQKIVYTFGPYGTSLFIPGYWSFDANRDLNWNQIQKLHRARGVQRQGEKLDSNRKESALQAKHAQHAALEAKKLGLRGEERYRFIKRKAGLDERTDDAQLRRLLRLVV
jgi:hypothetical protein